MNCPQCGAHNPESAQFCSLCLTSLAKVREVAHPPPAPAEDPDPVTAAPAVEVPGLDLGPTERPGNVIEVRPGASASAEAAHGRMRRTSAGFDWRCSTCDTWNPIEARVCTVCGRGLDAELGGATATTAISGAPADVNPSVVLATSVILPGLGHILLGRSAVGAGRLLLAVVWFLGGVALATQASSAGQSLLGSAPLFLGFIALALVSFVEAQSILAGRPREVLAPRAFLWLTTGVFGLTIIAMIPAVMSARG